MTDTTKLDLIQRLFAAFGREPNKEQATEWLRVADRYRTDFVSQAVESLIDTSNRFPTIADFRTACMGAWSRHNSNIPNVSEESATERKVREQAETEKAEWYVARFGTYAKSTRALIASICSAAKNPLNASRGFANLIVELEAESDFGAKYDRMKQYAMTVEKGTSAASDQSGF